MSILGKVKAYIQDDIAVPFILTKELYDELLRVTGGVIDNQDEIGTYIAAINDLRAQNVAVSEKLVIEEKKRGDLEEKVAELETKLASQADTITSFVGLQNQLATARKMLQDMRDGHLHPDAVYMDPAPYAESLLNSYPAPVSKCCGGCK